MTTQRECLEAKGIVETDISLRSLVDWARVDKPCDCAVHAPTEPYIAPQTPQQAVSPIVSRGDLYRELGRLFQQGKISLETYEEVKKALTI